MNCPKCGVNLEGGLIYDTFLSKYGEAKDIEVASMYGATKTTGRWGRQIGIEDDSYDGISSWRCPDCQHEWPRTFTVKKKPYVDEFESFKEELRALLSKHNVSFGLRLVKCGLVPHAKLSIVKKGVEVNIWITPNVKLLEEKHFTENQCEENA